MSPPPPSAARVIWILARTGLRRWTNRVTRQFRKKKSPAGSAAPRTATPRKRKGGGILLLFLGAIFLWNGIAISAQFLGRLEGRLEGIQSAEERPNKLKSQEAFRPRKDPMAVLFRTDLRAPPGKEGALAGAIGLLLLLLAAYQCLSRLDLNEASWNLEWLFTFPVPARVLFLSRILELAIVNPFGWFMTLPFLLALFLSTGWGWWGIPLAGALGLVFQCLVASVQMAAGIWFRKTCPPIRLRNLQGIFTILGLLLMMAIFYVALSPEIPAIYLRVADAIGPCALWNPFSLPAVMILGGKTAWIAAGAMALCGILVPWGATVVAGRLVRGGISLTTGLYQGKRSSTPVPRAERRWMPGGIIGKDLRLVLRDRTLLVQTLVAPLCMIGLQIIISPAIFQGVASDFRHAATLAFAVGAYVLMASAFHVLLMEGQALWLLYTFPQRLERILLRKTFFWCLLASFYTVLILAAAAIPRPALGLDGLLLSALAVAGVILHASIAACLGIISTDPLEAERVRKVDPMMAYLYLFIAALFTNSIYQPSLWAKVVQLVLTSVLAFALWQKVRDRLPFLLDPTEAPPPRLDLSDGLITGLSFFVIQGIFSFLLLSAGEPPGRAIFISFIAAGGIAGCFSLYVFWRKKVPGLLEAVGLRIPRGALEKTLGFGVLLGVGAALLGLTYLKIADRFEPLRKLKEESLLSGIRFGEEAFFWWVLLAVLAAPLFEEYIFRGLVYRGLRRSAPPAVAILLSAALFAIVHPPISIIPVFFLGAAAALALELTGCLLAPILVHGIYNALVLAAG